MGDIISGGDGTSGKVSVLGKDGRPQVELLADRSGDAAITSAHGRYNPIAIHDERPSHVPRS